MKDWRFCSFSHTMKVEATPILFTRGQIVMCLLYSVLFGCGNNRCNCGCGNRGNTRNTCGCGNCGNYGCGGGYSSAEAQGNTGGCSQCCCRNRSCCGFGKHGSGSVCCDECYYCRQYALCCCNCCSSCNNDCCGN